MTVSSSISPSIGSSISRSIGTEDLKILFRNNLQTTLVPQTARGDKTATFTRADPAFTSDFNGVLHLVKSAEARFKGARRVENLIVASEDMTDSNYATSSGAVIDNATEVTFDGTVNGQVQQNNLSIVDDGGGAGSRTFVYSIKIKLVTGTISANDAIKIRLEGNALASAIVNIGDIITSSQQRITVSAVTDAAGTQLLPAIRCNDALTLELTEWMLEETTGNTDTTLPSEYVSSDEEHGA